MTGETSPQLPLRKTERGLFAGLDKGISPGVMMAKRRLHPRQKRAIGYAKRRGLSDTQARIIDVFDRYAEVNPESPSIHEIVEMSGLSYGTVWTNLAVLEYFGYIDVCRNIGGRMYKRGLIVNYGFDLSEDYSDE